MLRIIDNKVYLEKIDVLQAELTTEMYLWKVNNKGKRGWMAVTDPTNGKNIIVPFEALSEENKEKFRKRFGDPYDQVARQPILRMVVPSTEALDFYKAYRYDETRFLPIETVHKYTRAAAWLQMLTKTQPAAIKKELGLRLTDFWSHVCHLVNIEKENGKKDAYKGLELLPGNFPSTYQRLKEKADRYKEEGYEYLIDRMFGNKDAAKIGKGESGFDVELERTQIALIRTVASKHQNFDAAQVTRLCRPLFDAKGWHMIGSSRMGQLMEEMRPQTTPGRAGKRAYHSTIAMQMKRKAPDFPTSYWTLDGWTVELLFQEGSSYSGRLVMVVVLDACGKYPVGYAIGERENTELIKEANRNAIEHMRELFGDYYQPYQLQSDNYGLKTLTPFYTAVGHLHTPAAVGNAKAKIIEPYFNYLNTTYCQLQHNWSGHNITSRKENQVNAEFLNVIKKTFPDRAGVIHQIHAFMAQERMKKLPEYMNAWHAMDSTKRRPIEFLGTDWLTLFGTQIGTRSNAITGQGIVKSIGGEQFTFDSFEPAFRAQLHLQWNIVADLRNLSRVLAVSEDGSQRFVLEEKRAVAMDIQSASPEDFAYLRQVQAYNKARMQEIMQTAAEDAQIVDTLINSAPLALDDTNATALKLMFTNSAGQQKEGIQDAKGLRRQQAADQKRQIQQDEAAAANWQEQRQSYLNSKTDFSQYLD